ncbi:MAG TPA: DUF5915 domain-containing protein, partial [Bacteroidota bacterium]|nr:DUF5915 domain-containing protein [Bacteroidota bacterium]
TLFDEEGLQEVQRKFFGTLVNTYAFFALYANIDGFTGSEQSVPRASRPEIDRWILSELHSLLGRYRELMDGYEVTRAARLVSAFTIDLLSNWYVRRNRRRFWKNEKGADKLSAYQTLSECLDGLTRMIAPFAPFLSEEIHRNLREGRGLAGAESVHLELLGEPDRSAIDPGLEAGMEKARLIVSLVRSIRNRKNLKVRQPLGRMIVPVGYPDERMMIERMKSVILDETNVKSIEFVGDDSGIVTKSIRPNFKTLGPKYGRSVQGVASAIRGFGAAEISALEAGNAVPVPVGAREVPVVLEDVEILRQEIEGWVVESDGGQTVALDTELTPELVSEGFAREFVNRIQNLRKDAGLRVTDRIAVAYSSGPRLTGALRQYTKYIQNETLAVELSDVPDGDGNSAEVDLNGEHCRISIKRIS